MRLMKIPTIWISFSGLILSTVANGFITITLEPQVLRKVRMTSMTAKMTSRAGDLTCARLVCRSSR